VLATLATSRTDQLLAARANSVEALLSGFHLVFVTSVALVAAGIVLGTVVLRRQSAVLVDGQALHLHDGNNGRPHRATETGEESMSKQQQLQGLGSQD
jgi:hypothetical protein